MIQFYDASAAQAAHHLSRLLGVCKVDTSDGMCSVEEIIGSGRAFVVRRQAVDVALIVIQKVERAHGRELEIRAAVALERDGGEVTNDILDGVQNTFGWDCDVMTIYTRRAGLVRKLERAGWNEAAKIMRKRIEK